MGKAMVGYSVGVITPKPGLGMAGYGSMTRVSTGTHDELHARALLIEKDGESFLIVQNEVLEVDYGFTGRVKDIAEKYGISRRDNVFVGATHTHSGPKGLINGDKDLDEASLSIRGVYDGALCGEILAVIEKCIAGAVQNKCPCVMRYGFSEVEGVGLNRNNRDAPCDKTLLAVEFIRDDGVKLLVYNFSCHPTVLNRENTLYTADWPYGVSKLAEGKTYEMAMFLNGSAGDVSTRFTRRAPAFAEAERIGGILYGGIAEAVQGAKTENIETIQSAVFEYRFELKSYGSAEEAQEKLDGFQKALDDAIARGEESLRLYESKVEGAASYLARTKALSGRRDAKAALRALRLNDLVFIFIPGELFSALALPVRGELGKNAVFCSYFSGYHGYIADTAAYDNETYEAMSGTIKRGEGEKLMDKAREIVLSMRAR